MNRLNKRLDPPACPEVEWLLVFARDGFDVACDLDSFQIIESDLVARSDTELTVGRVVGASEDGAETLTAASVRDGEIAQFVQAFAREG